MHKSVKIGLIIIALVVSFRLVLWYFTYEQDSENAAAVQSNNAPTTADVSPLVPQKAMIITSPSFQDGARIPTKFTCNGGSINPELQIQNVPSGAMSLVLVVEDPDAPSGTFTHWLVWNISPQTTIIKEESVPPGSIEGKNSFGYDIYQGPCPPPGGSHHYHFKLFALDDTLNLPEGSAPDALMAEIKKKNILATAELVGMYP